VIFVDANVFLRHLVTPATPQDAANARRSAVLFRRAEQGKEVITTSEATIAEVVFILSAKRHYNTPRATVATGLKPLLRPNNCRLTEKAVCLRALDLWVAHPRLSFPDALGAAYSEQLGHELATFDERLTRLPGIAVHALPEPGQDDPDETDAQ
jgi:predicted nucleic acid-binding protein